MARSPNRIPLRDLIFTGGQRCKCGGGLCHPVAPPENFPDDARGAWLCEHFFTERKLVKAYYSFDGRTHSLYPFGFSRKDQPFCSLSWELPYSADCPGRQTTRPGGYDREVVKRLIIMRRGVEIVTKMRDALRRRRLKEGKPGNVVTVSVRVSAAFQAAVDAGLDVGKLKTMADDDLFDEHFIARAMPSAANDWDRGAREGNRTPASG